MTDEPWFQIKPIEHNKLFENAVSRDIQRLHSELVKAHKMLLLSEPENKNKDKNALPAIDKEH
jgi:hypothetical protein